jgi:hypothetical protein
MERQRISKTRKPHSESFDPGRPKAPERAPVTPIHQLQETLGNRALGELIQAKLEAGAAQSAQSAQADAMERAAAETAQPLEAPVRQPLESSLQQDLSSVRVHAGPASSQAAESLGARAYTLGNDIHLGAEANRLSGSERAHLLAHEAVHTVQQGLQSVSPRGQLAVSNPHDAAEIEADHIARSVLSPATRAPSTSLAMRDHLRASPVAAHTVSRVAAPLVQRDIIKSDTVRDGTFDLNLVKETDGAGSTGLKGTIKFTPSATSPNASVIKLLQVARLEDIGAGGDYVWTGAESDKNLMQTTANATTGVEPGYMVDHLASVANPRTAKGDAKVLPYYRTYFSNATHSQDGSKSGATIQHASLWDWPKWASSGRFSFETAAKSVNSGYVYASVRWGFTVTNPGGVISGETATVQRAPSTTFGAAVTAFNEFYKNPGASTAP